MERFPIQAYLRVMQLRRLLRVAAIAAMAGALVMAQGNSGNAGKPENPGNSGNAGNNGIGNGNGNGNGNSGNHGQPENPGNSGNNGNNGNGNAAIHGPHAGHTIEWITSRSEVEQALLNDGMVDLEFISHADLENIVVWLTPSLSSVVADPATFDVLTAETNYVIHLSLTGNLTSTQGGTLHLRSSSGNARSFSMPFPINLQVPGSDSGDQNPEVDNVVSGATYHGGAIAPGQIVSLFGNGLGPDQTMGGQLYEGELSSYLGKTQVTFNGIPAALLATRKNQVNAVAPPEIAGDNQVEIVLTFGSGVSLPLVMAVQPTSPALFTLDGSGTGQAAAFNQDATINGVDNPDPLNHVVVLFGTGFGLWNESISGTAVIGSNLPTPAAAVSVTIGGVPATVIYVGGSPGSTSGLVQMNVVPGDGTPTGDAVEVIVTVGGESSPAGVTVALTDPIM